MLKHKGLLAVLLCIVIMGGCGLPKDGNNDPKANSTASSTSILNASGVSAKLKERSKSTYPPDFSTEKGIREYLVGEWVYDREYLNYADLDPANVTAKMIIDKDLNVHLSFEDKLTNKSKGEYTGEIKFDRLYAKPNEAPDLIVIDLGDEDYPGGDFRFLHRTIYDGKCVMSLFFSGNGNCIFDLLADNNNYGYAPEEIIIEKVSGQTPKVETTKNLAFHAVLWEIGAEGKSLWLNQVWWTPPIEYDPDVPNPRMALYEAEVPESALYEIANDKIKEIMSNELVTGEVYFVLTDLQGNVIEFENAQHKEDTKYMDPPEKDEN